MEYIKLQNSDLEVSRLCMGGCPMGGYGWGDVQEQELLDAIACAVENGINFFDTADTYGLGQSEKILAKGLGAKRKNVIIESKFGVRFGKEGTSYDNSPAYIQKCLEGTLQRLNTDYVDVYVVHYRDGKTPMADVVGKLEDLQKEGKLRYFGLSNIHEDGMAELEPFKRKFVCCQDEYSLACRKFETDLLKVQNEIGVTPLTWGSLGQGILTGKYDRNTNFEQNDRRSRDIYVNFHGEKLTKNLDIVDAMRPIAEAHKVSVAAVAIRFIMDHLKDSAVLVGAKRPAQIMGNLESIGWSLTPEELKTLDEISR
ncbi:aldo/keto reductase [Bacteroides acidifaciens]|uniref:aldo/keto reductase n=1 Tax=Bacteroides acidifaciens TaxID=85831 RepID=UPI00242F2DD3|nr:aldo/keto reductase [Bacteroides acidifaciens]